MLAKALQSYYVNVDVEDPYADSDELKHEYGFGLTAQPANDYDVVIITVPHKEYLQLDDSYFSGITKQHGLVADLKVSSVILLKQKLLEFVKMSLVTTRYSRRIDLRAQSVWRQPRIFLWIIQWEAICGERCDYPFRTGQSVVIFLRSGQGIALPASATCTGKTGKEYPLR